jgi:hypothetical protein
MDAANFVFPNDLHVHWSMMIALYPYVLTPRIIDPEYPAIAKPAIPRLRYPA